VSNSLIPLDTLASTIKASIAAGDRSLDKAEQHYKAAGMYLVEAKKRLKIEQPGKTFSAYLVGQCNMHTSRAYELIAIAEGKTSLAEVREKNLARKQKERASKTSTESEKSQQQENIEAADFEEPSPRKHVNIPPDQRLKLIGVITNKIRDAKLSDLKAIEKFISKQLED
jgi:hypothetical protein